MRGKNCGIIICRPRRAANRLAELLQDRGVRHAKILISPAFEIVPVRSDALAREPAAIVFTSENGVWHSKQLNISKDARAFCVGSRTALAAREIGFSKVRSAPTAAALVELLSRSSCCGRLLYVRGRHVSANLQEILRRRGIGMEEAVVYDQRRLALAREASSALHALPCIVPLFSARSARIFGEGAAGVPDLGHSACCISEQVARAFPLTWERTIARRPETEFVIRDTIARLRSIRAVRK